MNVRVSACGLVSLQAESEEPGRRRPRRLEQILCGNPKPFAGVMAAVLRNS